MKNGKRILSVTIKRMIDEDPDTSWLGEYASSPNSEFSIDRAHSEDCIENNQSAKDKLERIKNAIENDRPICEDHTGFYEIAYCEACQEEKAYTQAMDTIDELMECSGCAHRDRNTYQYFNPGTVESFDPNASWLTSTTDAEKRVEWEKCMRSNAKQGYDRMEQINSGNICFIGVRADACVALSVCKDHSHMLTQDITSGGLWGIESDSDKSYLESVEQDELADLRMQLKAIGFSSRSISAAFHNIERKED